MLAVGLVNKQHVQRFPTDCRQTRYCFIAVVLWLKVDHSTLPGDLLPCRAVCTELADTSTSPQSPQSRVLLVLLCHRNPSHCGAVAEWTSGVRLGAPIFAGAIQLSRLSYGMQVPRRGSTAWFVFVASFRVRIFGCSARCLFQGLDMLASQCGSVAGCVTSDAVPYTGRLWRVQCSSIHWLDNACQRASYPLIAKSP